MTPNSKILSVALAAAVLGGSTVALVNHSVNTKQAETVPAAATTTDTTQPAVATQPAAINTATTPGNNLAATTTQPQPLTNDQIAAANTSGAKDDQSGYREGYTQGLRDSAQLQPVTRASAAPQQQQRVITTAAPVRAATRPRYANSAPRYSNSTTAPHTYADYSQPRQRSFWQKHRDKLTVAAGTGGGALLGKIIGGGKGAAIGALTGAGGSALYTYKIRNKNRRY